jgi:hypothetical protein
MMDIWSWLQNLLGDTYWHWVERLSWLIAITLLPLGLLQLWFVWQEQRRIVAELTKQPDVRVGFFSVGGKLEDVAYVVTQWDSITTRSAPFELRISSHNVGARTAHNVLVNLIFPKETAIVSTKSTFQAAPDPFASAPEVSGGWRIWDRQPVTHPDVYSEHTTTLTAGESLKDGFDIGATVSMDDRPTAKHVLKVKFLRSVSDAEPKDAPQKEGG